MELLELVEKVKELFRFDDFADFGARLKTCVLDGDEATMDQFVELVGDLTVDWLQKIYQYYLADRKEKKQDFTPRCFSEFLSLLIGDADVVIDLCAGTGALTIQRWASKPEQTFVLFEIDDSVVPYLLFNLAVRNIAAEVRVGDALTEEYREEYRVARGEKYARVSHI